ncbi:nuclear transport factor 2 family protein [Pseudoalteromonas pernae]|uniref:nuclear transport factor 2 family protein n=1 Tax=Pseudoalteromonas pernae TaxID=3118054 RepID=UPI003242904C
MKRMCLFLLAMLGSHAVFAADNAVTKGESTPEIVENQLDKSTAKKLNKEQRNAVSIVDAVSQAYNEQDIDLFISYFAEDVSFYMYPNELMFSGKEQLIARYGVMFKNLKCVKSTPIKRIVHGNFVIDQELSESCSSDANVIDKRGEVVASYEVVNGLVKRVLFFKAPSK